MCSGLRVAGACCAARTSAIGMTATCEHAANTRSGLTAHMPRGLCTHGPRPPGQRRIDARPSSAHARAEMHARAQRRTGRGRRCRRGLRTRVSAAEANRTPATAERCRASRVAVRADGRQLTRARTLAPAATACCPVGVVHTMCVRACFRVCACVCARALCVLCAYVLRRMRPFGYIGLEHSQESQRHPQQQC